MHEHGSKRFSPKKMKKLDAPERGQMQPPAPLVDALELDGQTVVVDLGVGTGYFALPIAEALDQRGGSGSVVGLDVSREMLDEFEKRARNRELGHRTTAVKVTGEGSLPLEEGIADRVIIVNTAHELDHRPQVWRHIRRALKTGGFLLIVDWSPSGPFDHGPPADHRIGAEVLQQELVEAGFEVVPMNLYERFYAIKARA